MHETGEGLFPATRPDTSQPARRSRSRRSAHAAMADVQILAPTFLERWAVRRTLPHLRAAWTGTRLARWKGAREGSGLVVCGLAGALAPGLRAGTVLVPEWVGRPDGTMLRCDAGLARALLQAASELGFQPETGPMLTAPSLVTGSDRERWAESGYLAADMETGLLAGQGLRVATVRVILDDAQHPISEEWLTPLQAMLRPAMWHELWWLFRVAPVYSLRAAAVLKAAFDTLPAGSRV